MATTPAARTSGFPVDWSSVEVEGPPFTFDPMHAPHPISPLQQTLGRSAFRTGYSRAMEEVGIRIRANEARFVNHYAFGRMEFDLPDDPEALQSMLDGIEAAVAREADRMMERWHGEHLPRIHADIARLRALDLRGGSDAATTAQLDALTGILTDLWATHFRIAIPMLFSVQQFTELHGELFGGAPADAHALLAGGVSRSIRSAFGLSDLAAWAREHGLAPVFERSPDASLLADLAATPAGDAFLRELDRYLDAFGDRQDLSDLTTPTWREEPLYALRAVRAYLRAGYDAREGHAQVARAAHEAAEAARRALASYPEPIRARYEHALELGRQGAFLQEEHNDQLDQHLSAAVRHICLGLGWRLVDAGVLERPEDIFMLRIIEVHEIAFDVEPWRHVARVRALVAERSAELELARQLQPPMMLGNPQAASMPDTMLGRAQLGFFGGPPPAQVDSGHIQGHAGSRGVYTGIARVARSLAEAGDLQPGEVLVAVTTMPAWTPLFGIAGAIVTETGGPLSHCAIVAREYGIPAVVGAPGATSRIATGQRIGVDGDAGIVVLEPQASA